MSIKQEYKRKILGILSVLFPQAKIYLFGSRATNTAQKTSDIDIAIDTGSKMPFERIGEAQDVVRALYLPYSIDLVDFHLAPKSMQQAILKEGILWQH